MLRIRVKEDGPRGRCKTGLRSNRGDQDGTPVPFSRREMSKKRLRGIRTHFEGPRTRNSTRGPVSSEFGQTNYPILVGELTDQMRVRGSSVFDVHKKKTRRASVVAESLLGGHIGTWRPGKSLVLQQRSSQRPPLIMTKGLGSSKNLPQR